MDYFDSLSWHIANQNEESELEDELMPFQMAFRWYDPSCLYTSLQGWQESEFSFKRIYNDSLDPNNTYSIFGDKPDWVEPDIEGR
jgi:hypothetical protein